MKTRLLRLLALAAALLFAAASPCFAMMGLSPVSKAMAKEMGFEFKTLASGPDAFAVSLEFKTAGALARFEGVGLDVRTEAKAEDKYLVSAQLKERRPAPDRVAVSFVISRAELDKMSLRVIAGGFTNRVAYILQLKDFVALEPEANAKAPEKTAEKVAAPAATAK